MFLLPLVFYYLFKYKDICCKRKFNVTTHLDIVMIKFETFVFPFFIPSHVYPIPKKVRHLGLSRRTLNETVLTNVRRD
jgi:hypothetical protein